MTHRSKAKMLVPAVLVLVAIAASPATAQIPGWDPEIPVLPPAERDSLLDVSERLLAAGDLDGAKDILEEVADRSRKDAGLLLQIGRTFQDHELWEQATDTYKMARSADPGSPEICVALGLAYAESPARGLRAYHAFRSARGLAEDALRIDEGYSPAYRLLGEVYRRFQNEPEKALAYFDTYLNGGAPSVNGLFHYGLACVQADSVESRGEVLLAHLQRYGDDAQLLPLVAQALCAQGEYQQALETFERYLSLISGYEKMRYLDVSTIASRDELEQLHRATGKDHTAALDAFWTRRDPDILTAVNERKIEHYRRVWHASNFLAENADPWDRRGEVYIRYGEPDFRYRSSERNFSQTAEVEAIRNRMAIDMYGPEAAMLTFTGPIFPIRTSAPFDPGDSDLGDLGGTGDVQEVADLGDAGFGVDLGGAFVDLGTGDDISSATGARRVGAEDFESLLNFGGYAPVTMEHDFSTVPWETWTYVGVGDGMEITFTDEMGSGEYRFAPIPPTADTDQLPRLTRLMAYAPEMILERSRQREPDAYELELPGDPIEFYYDLANFKGADGSTALELYYGIPSGEMAYDPADEVRASRVECAFALARPSDAQIIRLSEELVYRGTGGALGGVVLQQLNTQLEPGTYELQVQLRDLVSDRRGVYRQKVEIKDFSSSDLLVSDIQLAYTIGDTGASHRYKKGDVWIIPMPTRAYDADQNVYAYFEIYNLTKNEFGQTRYRAEYAVRSAEERTVGIFSTVAKGFRYLFQGRKPTVAVTYEQSGTDPEEKEYVEIDLSRAEPGLNALTVTIHDLETGKKISREVQFVYGEGERKSRS